MNDHDTVSMSEPRRALCVSIHDVAPATWSDCLRLYDAVRAIADIPITWLVVPCFHGSSAASVALDAMLERQRARGDELALHGYTHRDDAPTGLSLRDFVLRHLYTKREGEFAAIGTPSARARIDMGLAWFAQRGWHPAGFVAPAWLLGDQAWRALLDYPFAYTTTYRRFYVLPGRGAGNNACMDGGICTGSRFTAGEGATTNSSTRAGADTGTCGIPGLRQEPFRERGSDSASALAPAFALASDFAPAQAPAAAQAAAPALASDSTPAPAPAPAPALASDSTPASASSSAPVLASDSTTASASASASVSGSRTGTRIISAPALVYTARNRAGRLLSPAAMTLTARCYAAGPLLRLALHPRDARHPALLRHMQALLAELLHTHQPMTKGAFAASMAARDHSTKMAHSTSGSVLWSAYGGQ